jgi:hypothetical protein
MRALLAVALWGLSGRWGVVAEPLVTHSFAAPFNEVQNDGKRSVGK